MAAQIIIESAREGATVRYGRTDTAVRGNAGPVTRKRDYEGAGEMRMSEQ